MTGTKVIRIQNYSDTFYVCLPFNIEYKSNKQISNKLCHNMIILNTKNSFKSLYSVWF